MVFHLPFSFFKRAILNWDKIYIFKSHSFQGTWIHQMPLNWKRKVQRDHTMRRPETPHMCGKLLPSQLICYVLPMLQGSKRLGTLGETEHHSSHVSYHLNQGQREVLTGVQERECLILIYSERTVLLNALPQILMPGHKVHSGVIETTHIKNAAAHHHSGYLPCLQGR